jgi:hypothetical protein
MNQTDEIDQIDRGFYSSPTRPLPLVVDFSTCWWISTTRECATSVHDSSLQGILSYFRMSPLARALRFRWDKNT